MKHILFSVISLVILMISANTTQAAIRRVNLNSPCTTGCDGSTWAKAFKNLQDAIDPAGDGDEIWVAAGVYYPIKTREGDYNPSDSRLKTFYINEDLRIFGGFAGNETTREQRNPGLFSLTVLSGNLGAVGNGDNAYHVVWVEDADADLDGLKVTEGNANHASDNKFKRGGGIYLRCSQLDILSCQIAQNRAVEGGAAFIFASINDGAGDQVLPCDARMAAYATQFTGNLSTGVGGAISGRTSGWNDDTDIYLEGCLFSSNQALEGSAVYYRANFGHVYANHFNCTFENNTATSEGGAIYGFVGNTTAELHLNADNTIFRNNKAANGGAVMLHAGIHDVLEGNFTNCIFSNNEATAAGAAIYFKETDDLFEDLDLNLRCRFSTFANNKGPANAKGNAIWVNSPRNLVQTDITNCIFWGNTQAPGINAGDSPTNISYTLTQGNTCEDIGSAGLTCAPANMIFNKDPQFVDAANNNFSLQPCSPAVNAGVGMAGINGDFFGAARSQHGAPDMGAVETATPLPPLTVVCKNIEVFLDSQNGVFQVPAASFDNGTSGCAPFTFKINNLSSMAATCEHLGSQSLTLTVTDAKGRTATCTPTLTVRDNTPPVVYAQDATVELNASGLYTLALADLDYLATDNCTIASQTLSRTNFTCADKDQTIPISVTVTDQSGNATVADVFVTVLEGKKLPNGWNKQGLDNAVGEAEYSPCTNAGTYTVSSTGFPANLTIDKRYFASRQLCGDGEIKAHIASLTGGGWAGLTMREGTGAGAKMVAIKIQQGSTMLIRESRSAANGIKQTQSYPQPQQPTWLKITRSGSSFSFYSSANGSVWQLVGTINIPMSNCIQVGLFIESINNTAITVGKFDQVQVVGSLALVMEAQGFEIHEERTTAPTHSPLPESGPRRRSGAVGRHGSRSGDAPYPGSGGPIGFAPKHQLRGRQYRTIVGAGIAFRFVHPESHYARRETNHR